jgi:hypothetical protein
MFVVCVSYNKDKRQNGGHTEQRSKDKVQTENKKKSLWEHGCLSFLSVVCCQVEVSATCRSPNQSPTDCRVSVSVI